MATKIIIAEKPSVAKAVAKVIGIKRKDGMNYYCNDDYIVTLLVGHIMEMYEPEDYNKLWDWNCELPIFPEEIKRKVSQDKKQIYRNLKTLLGENKGCEIIHCGDPDREGQWLVDEVLLDLRVKSNKRLFLKAINIDTIEKGLQNMQNPNEPMFVGWSKSAQTRGEIDWLVGINYTRAFSKKIRSGTISIGRVQTPTLAIIANRENAIKNFKTQEYFVLQVTFKKGDDSVYHGRLKQEQITTDKLQLEKIIKEISEIKRGTIVDTKNTTDKKFSPLPYYLSSLQKDVGKKLGIKAKDMLKIAQTLYDKALTTYPRTDCGYLPASFHKESKKTVDSLLQLINHEDISSFLNMDYKHSCFDDSKVNAHHGIIPLPLDEENKIELLNLSATEKGVYMEIVKRYLALFLPAILLEKISLSTMIGDYVFLSSASKVLNVGANWEILYKKDFVDKEVKENEDDIINKLEVLKLLEKNDTVTYCNHLIQTKNTTPPKRFTSGEMPEVMSKVHLFLEDISSLDEVNRKEYEKIFKETDGIGTEATRSHILDILEKRAYIEVKGKKNEIFLAEKGFFLMEYLKKDTQFFKIANPVFTASMEKTLKFLESSHKVEIVESIIDDIKKEIVSTITKLNAMEQGERFVSQKNAHLKCLKCGGEIAVFNRNEKMNYVCKKAMGENKQCDFSFSTPFLGAKIKNSDIEKLFAGKETSLIKGMLSSKTQKTFDAKLVFSKKDSKIIFKF